MKTILRVEDDDTLRGAMQMVLQREGCHIECASDGQQALDRLRRPSRPSLTLLDLMLPVLDGWQSRRAMKNDPQLAAIPVMVVSALDARRSLDTVGHIQKPFRPEELLDVVRRQTS